MGTRRTIWHHRYCTHGAYKFKNAFWRFFTQNLTINVIPEEIYVISHHVHHAKSDQPGDPYIKNDGSDLIDMNAAVNAAFAVYSTINMITEKRLISHFMKEYKSKNYVAEQDFDPNKVFLTPYFIKIVNIQ
ncbi:fatty-acid desaturase [Pedobacter cryoconitis]|uniref:Fatty-acid desaturase n=2 Tax=Pedobacter cryoconitis TaxID=188932 RepID=A0A7W8ZJY9_9SPHI|nr:fatty-acid desaturase [Pedobacter cryoconitis]